jgi:NTP pyrophosphatase (non-canonical NTP hydrolase)
MMLSFSDIREKNVRRSEIAWGCQLSDWSLAEWGNALAGEVGEACNVMKKILRLDTKVRTELADKDRAGYIADLGEELADAFLYMDLTAAAAGIDLEQEIIKKFNKKSRDIGSSIFL